MIPQIRDSNNGKKVRAPNMSLGFWPSEPRTFKEENWMWLVVPIWRYSHIKAGTSKRVSSQSGSCRLYGAISLMGKGGDVSFSI